MGFFLEGNQPHTIPMPESAGSDYNRTIRDDESVNMNEISLWSLAVATTCRPLTVTSSFYL